MSEGILNPVLIFTIMGILSSGILIIAAKFMFVAKDETAEKVREVLPGANCGACGYAGCDDYAAALAKGGVKTNLCIPGGDKCSRDISAVLGTDFEDVEEKAAFVHCAGDCHSAKKKTEYEGVRTCSACNMLYGGNGECKFACMGFGDCAATCPYGAIDIVDGIAKVNRELCTGCTMCVAACPKKLIEMVPANNEVFVTCSSTDKGSVTKAACSAGCIGCKLCEKKCPTGAITVSDNLATIDYSKCTNCGDCIEVCPTKVIHREPVYVTVA